MIIIVDFGSQTTHLIGRRLDDLGVESKIVAPEKALALLHTLRQTEELSGIILSGGPASVYENGAPTVEAKIFDLQVPVLGICYGWQLMAKLLGGEVKSAAKEYGAADLIVAKVAGEQNALLIELPTKITVWESHGDSVVKLPKGFNVTASTHAVEFAAVANTEKKLFGVQFHPEMSHTEFGTQILKNFANRICELPLKPKKIDIDALVNDIKAKVGDKLVVGAFSGGTDSSVAGTLVARAVGKQFIPVYIDSGLMRADNLERVNTIYPKLWGIKVHVIEARKQFLAALKGVTDPEAKRKAIGHLYIKLFEEFAASQPNVEFLLQGTTYADFIHSQGNKRSALIKSHHNVGGLPKHMKQQLLEPLRYYYTDQVRQIGVALGLPKDVVYQQPFPGPGHAVRILGEVTSEKLVRQVQADNIVVEVLKEFNWYDKVFQCWSILTNAQSTAVKGDGRFFGDVVAIRVVESTDRMSANWVPLPAEVLSKLATRIVNEVPGISRVVYDITSKPPATMEWE